jgi:hypothetical protein
MELVGINSKIVRFCILSVEIWTHNAPPENKAGSDAVTTHSDTQRDVPGGLSYHYFSV